MVDFLHEFLNVLVVVVDVVVHVVGVVGVVHNACALPVPCSHRFMLGVVFSASFWVSLLVRSWAGLRSDFDRFLFHLRPPETSKNIKKPMVF